MKIFVIGPSVAAEPLAKELSGTVGVEAVCLDKLYLGLTPNEGDERVKEAVSEQDWVVWGSEFSNREGVMRAASLIAVASIPLPSALLALSRLGDEERKAARAELSLHGKRDTGEKLNIRLVAFGYKVRRVKGALGRRKLLKELEEKKREEG